MRGNITYAEYAWKSRSMNMIFASTTSTWRWLKMTQRNLRQWNGKKKKWEYIYSRISGCIQTNKYPRWNKTFKINIFLIPKVETSNESEWEKDGGAQHRFHHRHHHQMNGDVEHIYFCFRSYGFSSRFSNYTLRSYFFGSSVSRKVCFFSHSWPPTLTVSLWFWFLPALNVARGTASKRSSSQY